MSRRNTTIGADEFKGRVVDLCLKSDSLGLPRKKRDRHIVLKSIALMLDPHRAVTVGEVDAALDRWRCVVAQRLEVDHSTLRRGLVEGGFVRPNPDGSFYTVADPGPGGPVFSCDVQELDVVDIALHGICDIEQQRRNRIPTSDSDEGRRIVNARIIARRFLDGQIDLRTACGALGGLFDKDLPFLSELVYFYCGYWMLLDDEQLARNRAAEFLDKSDEWFGCL